jgi:hypothetical protein
MNVLHVQLTLSMRDVLGSNGSHDSSIGTATDYVFKRMVSSGMLRRVTLVRTDVSEELSASFNRVTRIGELGTTLAVTSNRRTA